MEFAMQARGRGVIGIEAKDTTEHFERGGCFTQAKISQSLKECCGYRGALLQVVFKQKHRGE